MRKVVAEMSVNHYLLPVTDGELDSIFKAPETIHDLIELRSQKLRTLGTNGIAIVVMTASSEKDPLNFIMSGAPKSDSGWIGQYIEEGNRVVTCEVDMGYGPASYYRNRFLRDIARALQPITVEKFMVNWDADWLENNHIYPSGWHDEWRKDDLAQSYVVYRACILAAAESGQHLLVWCA